MFAVLFRRSMLSRVGSPTGIAGIGVAALTLAFASPVAAQVVYDGGAPNQDDAYISAPARGVQAETFTIGSSISFNTVQWYGGYAPTNSAPATDAFTILFFNTLAGVPEGTPIVGLTFNVGNNVNRTATGQVVVGQYSEYVYHAGLPGSVNLLAGTYAISIVNDAVGTGDFWFWETTNPVAGGEHFSRSGPSVGWNRENDNLSFRLLNVAAPEPGSLALLALAGLPVVGVVVRRNRVSAGGRRS